MGLEHPEARKHIPPDDGMRYLMDATKHQGIHYSTLTSGGPDFMESGIKRHGGWAMILEPGLDGSYMATIVNQLQSWSDTRGEYDHGNIFFGLDSGCRAAGLFGLRAKVYANGQKIAEYGDWKDGNETREPWTESNDEGDN